MQIMALVVFSPEPLFFFGIRRHADPSLPGQNLRALGRCRGARVSSGLADCDRRAPDFTQESRVSRRFSAPVLPSSSLSSSASSSSSSCSKKNEDRQNYYVNTGHAIRTLREEFPALFYRELTFNIYRDDIVFKDPHNTFVGIDNYKLILWGLRFHGKMFFKALWIDIISVWQPVENVIMIRWVVHGIPRVMWESHGRFDGTSLYKLDKDGKIFEHRVDNIALNSPPPTFRVLSVEQLIQALGCPSTPKPTCFETLSTTGLMILPPLARSSWAWYYLIFHLILAWRRTADT